MKNVITIEQKASILASRLDLLKECKINRKHLGSAVYRLRNAENEVNYQNALNDLAVAKSKIELCESCDSDYRVCERIIENNYHRTNHLRLKMINLMTDSELVLFLTLTFTNEVLEKTSPSTRRKYVVRCLKSVSDVYIANIDFGKKNEREHYHAVIGFKNGERLNPKVWKYGNIDFKEVSMNDNTIKVLPRYINKLTNHAIKETTKSNRVIYSR